MDYVILSLIGLPLLGFLITVFLPKSNENTIAQAVRFITGLHLILSLVFVTFWLVQGASNVHLRETSIMKSAEYDFFIDLYADRLTVVFLLFGSILTFLIGIFSRRYFHRYFLREFRNHVHRLGSIGHFVLSPDCLLPNTLPAGEKCRKSVFYLPHR